MTTLMRTRPGKQVRRRRHHLGEDRRMEHPRPHGDEQSGALRARERRDRRGPRFVLGVEIRRREQTRKTHLRGGLDEARDVGSVGRRSGVVPMNSPSAASWQNQRRSSALPELVCRIGSIIRIGNRCAQWSPSLYPGWVHSILTLPHLSRKFADAHLDPCDGPAVLTSASVASKLRPVAAAPCTKATNACERWITFGRGPARSMVYASYPLDVRESGDHARAHHGPRRGPQRRSLLRDRDGRGVSRRRARQHDHHRAALHRAAHDKPAAERNHVAGRRRQLAIRRHVADASDASRRSTSSTRSSASSPTRRRFPNLTRDRRRGALGRRPVRDALRDGEQGARHARVSVSAMSSRIRRATHGRRRCGRFRPATPIRPTPTRRRSEPTARRCTRNFTFGPFDTDEGAELQSLASRSENRDGLHGGHDDDQLKKQLVERPTTYLLGQVDVLPLGGFDSSPNAMAQGPTRRARGEAFFKYVTETLGAKHNAIIVPECGHNDRCIFTTDVVFPVIFPK